MTSKEFDKKIMEVIEQEKTKALQQGKLQAEKEFVEWLKVYAIHILHNECEICNYKIEQKIKELEEKK